MNNFNISSVVLTCDSYLKKSGCIEHALLSLLNQKGVSQEIVIVDNSQTQESRTLLQSFISSLNSPMKVIEANTSIAKARNLGGRASLGDLILFIDEDTIILDDSALQKICEISPKYPYGYGAKRYWTKSEEWFFTNAHQLKKDIQNNSYALLRKNIGDPSPEIRRKSSTKYLVRSFIGNFGYIERKVFKEIGGFPEIFQGYGVEDDAMSFLCYLKFGRPSCLKSIETVHITHEIAPVCYENYEKNQILYKKFLKDFGYKAFHIGDLLYPEKESGRPILESL